MIDVDSIRRAADPIAVIGQVLPLAKQGREWVAPCPFHEDSTPSFTVTSKGYKCFGCEARGDVIRFFQEHEGLKFQDAAARVAELAGIDLPKGSRLSGPRVVCEYLYRNAAGEVVYKVVRYEPKDFRPMRPDGRGGWLPGIKQGDRVVVERVLYRLPELLDAPVVFFVEGEKDADNLAAAGFCATTLHGGSSSPWCQAYSDALLGKRVFIIPDRDEAGRRRAQKTAENLRGVARYTELELPWADGETGKDISDWLAIHSPAEFGLLVSRANAAESDPLIGSLPLRVWDAVNRVDFAALLLAADEFAVMDEAEFRIARAKVAALMRSAFKAREFDSAIRQARHGAVAGGDEWTAELQRSSSGTVKSNLANAVLALSRADYWEGVIAFDEFRQKVYAMKPFPGSGSGPYPRPWRDQDGRLVAMWLQTVLKMDMGPREAFDAVQKVAEDHTFHPVRAYLRDLVWDGEPRIDRWLTAYLGAEETPYTCAVGAAWLISAVARVMQPGCKADSALVLEGIQDLGKSRTLSILGGEWYMDDPKRIGSPEIAAQIAGRWIVELAEMQATKAVDVETIKAFLSRQTDVYRRPYAMYVQDVPRQCVFVGTTNADEYLQDITGNRRFWPVRCEQADLAALAADRDQIWAEAFERYQAGAKWWLTGDLKLAAAEEAAKRLESHPWEDLLSRWMHNADSSARAPRAITSADALKEIGKQPGQWTKGDEMLVGRCLRRLGWRKWQRGESRQRCWIRDDVDD